MYTDMGTLYPEYVCRANFLKGMGRREAEKSRRSYLCINDSVRMYSIHVYHMLTPYGTLQSRYVLYVGKQDIMYLVSNCRSR
jgi:hypothetical protein